MFKIIKKYIKERNERKYLKYITSYFMDYRSGCFYTIIDYDETSAFYIPSDTFFSRNLKHFGNKITMSIKNGSVTYYTT